MPVSGRGTPINPGASSIAIADGKILEIGDESASRHVIGPETEVLDMQGKFITPGFIDTHIHMMMGGNSLLSVALRDAATPEEFTTRIAAFARNTEAGSWILEGNWDHTLWGGELPRRDWIDDQTPDNPVFLYRLDGHMALANSKALQLAGINSDTPDVTGGEIVRDSDGNPTGILKDNAMNLVLSKIPPMTADQKQKALKAAMAYCLSNGITTVHEVDSLLTYEVASYFKTTGELPLRMYVAEPLNSWNKGQIIVKNEDEWVKTGLLKGFIDGSLGSHTAAFSKPYSDKANDHGFFINKKEDLYQWVSDADKANLQVAIHAIGDSAVHTLLDIYEQVITENGPKDRRFRIEHAQHLAPGDIPRFAGLGVVASMQPYHAIDDGRWAEGIIGPERVQTTYAFKSLLDANAKVVFGSDWPVAPATPLEGIYAAVTRRTLDNKHPDGWVPEQKITVEQALTAYTRDAAYASFEESKKGTLEKGKMADFVVMDQNMLKVATEKIKAVRILQTYVGGKKVYSRD